MPAAGSKRKSTLARRPGSKAARLSSSSQRHTPLRQSSRVKKNALVTAIKRPLKRSEPENSEDENANGNDNSAPDSDYTSPRSEAADEGGTPNGEDYDDDVDDSDGPQSYSIPLPKVREAGDTPYDDARIHPNTFLFLRDLKANNNRDWLKWNDKDFRNSLKDFESFIKRLSDLIMERDPTIPELPNKDIIFRIYRDVRFSSDPTPYKPHFSAAWSRTGKKGPYAAYYLQLQPGASFVGGGLWHPDGPALATIREDIDQHPQHLKGALMNNSLRRTFFEKAKNDEKKVVASFVAANAEGALKTKPKGFVADHKDLNLLRLRNFTLSKKITDGEVLSEGGIMIIANIIGALVPWVTYLNSIVMPDPPAADSSEDSDSG